MLSAWNRRKRANKIADEEPASLVEFLAAEEGYEGLTSLEVFAKEYQTRGEKLIAATMYSRLNDKFYAQWLALNVPFRSLNDFEKNAPEIMEKVNEKYRNFALCMHYAPGFWDNDAAIQATVPGPL